MNGLKIALTGSNGFLAESIKARCKDQHHLNFLSLNSLNTGNYDEDIIEKHLSAEMPDYLIHTSSITDVDYCEKNGIDVESVPKLISKPLKEKLKWEATELNYLKRTSRAKLPL